MCKAALDKVYAGDLYFAKAASPQDQGALVDQADAILATMVQQLKALPTPSDADDARVVQGWLADWDTYLSDRVAWVTKLKTGEAAVFYVHSHEGGTPVTDAMDEFVQTDAGDGFVMVPHLTPGGLDEFAEKVVPLLQERGSFRTEYTGTTLREHLGLAPLE